MLKFTIKPYDVIFFGSGKPFNIGGDAQSIFPPFPHSFASAVYAKFFAETKIEISEEKGIYKAVYGPFLKKGNDLLFPAPMDILKEKKKEKDAKITLAIPKEKNDFKLIDFSDSNFPFNPESILWAKSDDGCDYEPFNGYITLNGLKAWFNNENIEIKDLVYENEIFEKEERISINLDENKTVKKEDGLYRVQYIRLKDDVSFQVWIDFDLENDSILKQNKINDENELKEIFEKKPLVLKLGGETKVASYEVEINDFYSNFSDLKTGNSNKSKILFLTPGVFINDAEKSIVESTCAAIGGYTICGISSKYNKKYSNKTIRAIKAGSILYLYLYLKDFEKSKVVDFFKNDDRFIGSNLILIK